MKDRIVAIRKAKKLSQAGLAEKVGLSRNFIGLVESGERNLSERSIKDICSSLNVNYEWLKNGHGEMFSDEGDAQAIIDSVMTGSNERIKKSLAKLASMSEEQWEALFELVDMLSEE